MIATLSGKLLLRYQDRVIVDVGGVGYEVYLSAEGLSRLGECDTDIFLFIYTHVREDAIILYGFREEEEKEMFLILKTVSGIGPKLALSILSGMRVSELCRAIGSKDIKLLTSLQGVGKRTAERLCVDLQEKVGHLASETLAEHGDDLEINRNAGSIMMDVISALVNLGYPDPVARQALVAVKKRVGREPFADMSLEEMLKEGLRTLA
ncbi:Holliday junction branch migration protein RuvA [Desulfopila inferna]|uniref:Holliday junction branch migration protein RuvA n=1 Tax=Desulfopila inferna TaxID=468528 RepID=UPI001966BDA5|nr:Holliday junction branch migration protein RuvA [Desulfopila inferna]MBM9604420.1 Holliday junction branch migration protein RuvA [Desulfopila inferna]